MACTMVLEARDDTIDALSGNWLQRVSDTEVRGFLETLFEKERGTLETLARKMLCGDVGAAEDVVQDAFCAAWAQRTILGNVKVPAAWLRRIVRNKAIDHIRKQSRIECAGGLEAFEASACSAPLPDFEIDRTLTAKRVHAAISQLDEKQRYAARLHYILGCPVNRVAELAQVPAGTIKSRLFHARKQLTRKLHNLGASPES